MKKNHNTLQKKQKGFTLLFALLVSTLVISIGATIISISLRQTILSGTSRESNYAFYAANTALECAIYWDKTGVAGDSGFVFPVPNIENAIAEKSDIFCAGINITSGEDDDDDLVTEPWSQNNSTGETTFYIEVKDLFEITQNGQTVFSNDPYCAQATVTKSNPDSNGVVTTRIEARGYNTCDVNNPRRVERGIIEEYQS